MIKYTLTCAKKHEFESWFSNSEAYDDQAARGLVTCPLCGSKKVGKALMAPKLGRNSKKASGPMPKPSPAEAPSPAPEAPAVPMMSTQEQEIRAKLKELKEHIVKNADNVGPRFAEEARKMHYGEIEHRSIYGEASREDAEALQEEGIEFHPLPMLPDDRN